MAQIYQSGSLDSSDFTIQSLRINVMETHRLGSVVFFHRRELTDGLHLMSDSNVFWIVSRSEPIGTST